MTDVEGAGRRIGWLYGVNMLGAAAGALATPWLLLPALGVRGAVARRGRREPRRRARGPGPLRPAEGVAGGPAGAGRGPGRRRAGAERPGQPAAPRSGSSLYALSGFVALSLEIVWFRLLDVAVKSTAFTFGTVLAVYLLGLGGGRPRRGTARGAGCARPLRAFLLVPVRDPRARRPAAARRGRAAAGRAGVLAGSSTTGRSYAFFPLGHDSDRTQHPAPLRAAAARALLRAHGAHGPLVPDPAAGGPRRPARRAAARSGRLQAANIAGCVAGSLLVGLVSLQHLGHAGNAARSSSSARASSSPLVGARYYGRGLRARRRSRSVVLAVRPCPGQERLWRRLHGLPAGRRARLLRRGRHQRRGPDARTRAAGGCRSTARATAGCPYGSGHTRARRDAGDRPPGARCDVAVVGLGLGRHRLGGGLARARRDRLTVFEISAPQPRVLWRLARGAWTSADTRHLLEDPRVRIRIEDGRKALEAEATLYDLDRGGRHLARDRGQRQPLLARVLLRPRRAGSSRGGSCAPGRRPRGCAASFRGRLPARPRGGRRATC